MNFQQMLEQDLKDDIIADVMTNSDDQLIDGFITQNDIDKANTLSDDEDETEESEQEV